MLVPSVYVSVANTPTRPARNAPATPAPSKKRRGTVLLIVLVMLVMFAVIGLAFMFYAESDQAMATAYRDSQNVVLADIDPEQAFAYFLQQMIYDCKDDSTGRASALRGHSLMRSMYGQNYTPGANLATMTLGSNFQPYNGTGRLHYPYSGANAIPAGQPGDTVLSGTNPNNGSPKPITPPDDYYLPNYQYHPEDGYPKTQFVRDPERLGARSPTGTPNAYAYGQNAPYTYADLNNMYLAAITNTGTVLSPSYHRNNFGGNGISLLPGDPSYAFWSTNDPTRPWLKYTTLRPRPVDHPAVTVSGIAKSSFPMPEDQFGDVRNRPLAWGPAGNDSVWLYAGAPIWTLPDGRMFTMMHAPLIIDLDSKVNINASGNIAGAGNTHVSNQGFGDRTDVNVGTVLPNTVGTDKLTDVQRLKLGFKGNGTTVSVPGLYGPSAVPGAGAYMSFNAAGPAFLTTSVAKAIAKGTHKETPTSMAGINVGTVLIVGTGATTEQVTVSAVTPAFPGVPTSFTATYANAHKAPVSIMVLIQPHSYATVDFDARQNPGGAASAPWSLAAQPYQIWPQFPATTYLNATLPELLNHPLLYDPTTGYPTTGYRIFGPADMEMFYRNGDLGTDAMQSDLAQLLSASILNPTACRSFTALSFDRTTPGMLPWMTNAGATTYKMAAWAPNTNANAAVTGPVTPSTAGPLTFPAAGSLANAGPEFGTDGRGVLLAALSKIDLNRALPIYPLVNHTTQTFNLAKSTTTPSGFAMSAADQAAFQAATQARQKFATDILNVLRKLTGVYNPDFYSAPTMANPTGNVPAATDLQALRYLAQLAVNIVDFIDDDDVVTPFPWTQAIGNAGFQAAYANDFVFGTELPKLVINEVYTQYSNDPNDPGLKLKVPHATYYDVDNWVELCNPLNADTTFMDGGQGAARLYATPPGSAPNVGYSVYQLLMTHKNSLLHAPENTSGMPDWIAAGTYKAGTTTPPVPGQTQPVAGQVLGTVATEWNTPVGAAIDGSKVLPLKGGYAAPNNQGGNQTAKSAPTGFYVVGPSTAAGVAVPFPSNGGDPVKQAPPTATINAKGMRYQTATVKTGAPVPIQGQAPVFLLQRLLCPYAPPDPNPTMTVGMNTVPNPTYNPYITVDTFTGDHFNDNANFAPKAKQLPLINTLYSVGRVQPYATKKYVNQTVYFPANQQPTSNPAYPLNQPQHTFFQYNAQAQAAPAKTPPPPYPNTAYTGFWPPAAPVLNQQLTTPYSWLTHMDRPLISPMELLHVSGYRPHELTFEFNGTPFGQQAPWLDDTKLLYRFFEFAETHSRQAGTFVNATGSPTSMTRLPGKLNINTIWDLQTFQALCDAQNGNQFKLADVNAVWNQLLALRTPNGTLSASDRPFLPFSAGFTQQASNQYPLGTPLSTAAVPPATSLTVLGIEDTILRPFSAAANSPGPTAARLFRPAATSPVAGTAQTTLTAAQEYEMLIKIYNNMTTRSNCFAVWCTVGFFEVNQIDSTGRIFLGAELNRSTNKHIRHRMFSIIDRSAFQPVFKTTLTKAQTSATATPQTTITAAGTWTITPATMSGSATTFTNNTQAWSIQPGMTLQISDANGSEEAIVTATAAATFTVNLARTYTGTITIQGLGNPGPTVQFNPHSSLYAPVVTHFTIIE